jgi:transcriptional regulator with XRE-family HTH domain
MVMTIKDEDLKMTSKLAEYRKRKGLSQDKLAQVSGLTKTTIQNWENGRNLGAVARILRVCQELDVDIRELFELDADDDELESEQGKVVAR